MNAERLSPLARLNRFLDAESEASGLSLRALIAIALVLHVWVTLLAINPLHPDEHFQILEFAWARAGLSPAADLPWEWRAQMRSTLQPTLAMGLLRVLRGIGVTSPFIWMYALRFLSLAMGFAVLMLVCAREAPTLGRAGRRAIWLTALLLWIAPLLLARFTSENLGGLTLAAAIVCIERSWASSDARRRFRSDAVAGVLLGASFLLRFEMAMAIVPILAWVVAEGGTASRGTAVKRAAVMAAFAAVIVAAGFALDAWFYGNVVFTPWNYFRANVLNGRAASFGTSPWYEYALGIPLWLAPPLGIVLAVLVILGLVARPRSAWTWAVVGFVVGHSIVGHKEFRFMLPLLYALPVLVGRGVASLPVGRWRARWKWGAWLLVAQNVALLLVMATPAFYRGKEFDLHYVRWLWRDADRHPGENVYVLTDEPSAWRTWDLEMNVYRHVRVIAVPHRAGDAVGAMVPAGTPPDRLLVLTRGATQPLVAGTDVGPPVYVAEPGYVVMARAAGVNDASWLRWLEAREGWTGSTAVRRLYSVRVRP